MMRRLFAGAAVLLLAGCGAREQLEAPPGESLPPAPYGARATPTPDDLLTPPVQSRPGRSGDLIESADPREGDEFDLPPPN